MLFLFFFHVLTQARIQTYMKHVATQEYYNFIPVLIYRRAPAHLRHTSSAPYCKKFGNHYVLTVINFLSFWSKKKKSYISFMGTFINQDLPYSWLNLHDFCCRDNASLQLSDIQGGLIFVKKYSVHATAENELVSCIFFVHFQKHLRSWFLLLPSIQ